VKNSRIAYLGMHCETDIPLETMAVTTAMDT